MRTFRPLARKAPGPRRLLTVACAAACAWPALPALALDVTWLGGAGDWSEARWSGGNIADGAHVHARIDGGNTLASAVDLHRSASIGRLSLSAGDTLRIAGDGQLALLDGGVSGAGSLRLDGRTGRASVVVGTSSFSGGLTEMQGVQALIYGTRLDVAADHVLRGNGALGDPSVALLGSAANHGLVRAEGSLGLSIGTASGFVNAGTVELEAGSRLQVSGGSFSGGGVLRSSDGFGALNTTGNGQLRDLRLDGRFSVRGDHNLVMGGTVSAAADSPAWLHLDGSSGRAALVVDGALTLQGNMTLDMSGPQALVYGGVLTFSDGLVLVRRGQFGDASVAALAGVINTSLIEVLGGGGELGTYLAGGSFRNDGTVRIGGGGRFVLQDTDFSGGAIDGVVGGRLAGGTFRDTRWLGNLVVSGGDTVATSGTITLGTGVDGTNMTRLLGDTARAALVVDNTTLAGAGTLHLFGTQALVYGNQLTIGPGVTVVGVGGSHLGDPSVALLGGVRNEGLVKAPAGDFNVALGGGRFDNMALVEINDQNGAGRLVLRNTAFSGGTVRGHGAAAIAGDTLSDTRLEGSLRVRGNDTLSTSGTLTVAGTLDIDGTASRAALATTMTTLVGDGLTRLSGPQAVVYGPGLVIGAGHRLHSDGGALGDASVALLGSVQVQGLLRAEGDGLRVHTGGAGVVNEGHIEVAAGSRLVAPADTLQQTSADASLQVDGLLQAAAVDVQAGTLAGLGLIDASTSLGAATLAPGSASDMAGTLSFNQALRFDTASSLSLDLLNLSLYDQVAGQAAVALAGTLALTIGPAAMLGDRYTVLTAAGGLEGRFDSLSVFGATGWAVDLSYGANDLVVTLGVVPEPGSGALLAAGLLSVGALVRRRLPQRGG